MDICRDALLIGDRSPKNEDSGIIYVILFETCMPFFHGKLQENFWKYLDEDLSQSSTNPLIYLDLWPKWVSLPSAIWHPWQPIRNKSVLSLLLPGVFTSLSDWFMTARQTFTLQLNLFKIRWIYSILIFQRNLIFTSVLNQYINTSWLCIRQH